MKNIKNIEIHLGAVSMSAFILHNLECLTIKRWGIRFSKQSGVGVYGNLNTCFVSFSMECNPTPQDCIYTAFLLLIFGKVAKSAVNRTSKRMSWDTCTSALPFSFKGFLYDKA